MPLPAHAANGSYSQDSNVPQSGEWLTSGVPDELLGTEGAVTASAQTSERSVLSDQSLQPQAETVAVHALTNGELRGYVFVAEESARGYVANGGWTDLGVAWYAPDPSSAASWAYEGVAWYSDDAKTVPLFREYNPNEPANNHNYTTDAAEQEHLVSLGWVDEGYAWYGV